MRLASLRPWPRGVRLAPVLVLALALPAAADTMSNPLISYSTSGAIGSAGVTGFDAVSFQSATAIPAPGPTSISLGDFQVAALPSGVATTYANTPFTITFLPYQSSTAGSPLVLQGTLNGTVNGSTSNIVATFSNLPGNSLTEQFQAGSYAGNLTLAAAQNPLSSGGASSASWPKSRRRLRRRRRRRPLFPSRPRSPSSSPASPPSACDAAAVARDTPNKPRSEHPAEPFLGGWGRVFKTPARLPPKESRSLNPGYLFHEKENVKCDLPLDDLGHDASPSRRSSRFSDSPEARSPTRSRAARRRLFRSPPRSNRPKSTDPT